MKMRSFCSLFSSRYFITVIFFLSELFFLPTRSFNYHRLRPGCELVTNDDWIQPQVLLLNAEKTKIIPPGLNDSVFLSPLEEIVLACPNSTVLFNNVTTEQIGATAKCNYGTTVTIKGNNFDFKDISCAKLPKSTTKVTGKCFNSENILKIEIGFDVGSNFINIMTICFDNNSLSTVYSHFNATSKIIARQKVQRPKFFEPADYYQGIKIWTFYSKYKQRKTIEKILGSKELAEKYIKNDTNYFLSRGHLTAKADFIYAAEQFATFYYINVAPQWQVINSGNWGLLEESVRQYAIRFDLNLLVYTIPYDVLELPDVNGVLQKIYLYYDEEDKNKIKVPKFYIKIVFNEKEGTGTTFLTVNNPYLQEITEEYILCNDICHLYDWLKWDQENVEKGYSYCCSYDQLKSKITGDFIPDLPIDDILAY